MKLTILGSGTSTGVPLPGCPCEVCTSGDPKNIRYKTSALISDEATGANILIDASTDFRHQALRAKIPSIDAVLFTHSHADHIFGIDDLRVYNYIKQAPIPCYGAPKTLREIRRVFEYIFSADRSYEGGPLAQLELIEIEYGVPFSAAATQIIPFYLDHGRIEVAGFRIGDLVYATDCKSAPAASKEIMRGARHLVLDGLRYEPHRTHLTIPEAVELSRELQADSTYLIHMTHSIDYHEVSAKLPKGVQLAYDGLEIQF